MDKNNRLIRIITDGIQSYLPRISIQWWIFSLFVVVVTAGWNYNKFKKQGKGLRSACLSEIVDLYFWMVIIVTFGTRLPDPHFEYQLVPFFAHKKAFICGDEKELFQILCNIVMFIPFGVLFPIWKEEMVRNVFHLLKYAFYFSFGIELLQLMTKIGCFEIDDMINNVLGAAMGYLCLCIIGRIKRLWVKIFNGKILESGS